MWGKIVLFISIFFYAIFPHYEAVGPFWSTSSDAILHWSTKGLRHESTKPKPMEWKSPQKGSGEPLLLDESHFEEPFVHNFGMFDF